MRHVCRRLRSASLFLPPFSLYFLAVTSHLFTPSTHARHEGYPACQAPFSPDDTYRTQTLAAHESEPKTEYFLVTNKHEARPTPDPVLSWSPFGVATAPYHLPPPPPLSTGFNSAQAIRPFHYAHAPSHQRCASIEYGNASKHRHVSPSPPAYAGPSDAGSDTLGGVIVSAEGHFFRDDSEVNAALCNSRLQIKMFRNVTSAREWFIGLPPAKEEDEDGKEQPSSLHKNIHVTHSTQGLQTSATLQAWLDHYKAKPTSATLQAWLEHYNASPPAADIHERRRHTVVAPVAARQVRRESGLRACAIKRALERCGWPPAPCHPNHPENRRVVEEQRKQKERKAAAEREKQAAAAKALVDELMELRAAGPRRRH
ncbi:hypothetical protein B0H16DRAFT_1455095 [Mycena metata]|uniref:Uncharacterized protein n=1 Tax=Mycena metata TaxID=1033252 RepID=A0AAD7JFR0_9AGAR|nr:hypothetical protein B0H16DRAFT_1455095 [Mycena metata]